MQESKLPQTTKRVYRFNRATGKMEEITGQRKKSLQDSKSVSGTEKTKPLTEQAL